MGWHQEEIVRTASRRLESGRGLFPFRHGAGASAAEHHAFGADVESAKRSQSAIEVATVRGDAAERVGDADRRGDRELGTGQRLMRTTTPAVGCS